MSQPIWWEKTVEYRFLAEAVVAGLCDFAAPLAGRYERTAGDAVFGVNARFILVEFKRAWDDLPSEKTLFHNYGHAVEQLKGFLHHFIVFGEPTADQRSFFLVARRYFEPEHGCAPLDVFQAGTSREDFDAYLEVLASHKKADGRGAGHVSAQAMSAVIGVSGDGKMVGALALHDYAQHLFSRPAPLPQAPVPTQRMSSGPRF